MRLVIPFEAENVGSEILIQNGQEAHPIIFKSGLRKD